MTAEAERKRAYNAQRRDPALRAMYRSAAWQRTRSVHLAKEPLCRDCRAVGVVTAATEVDHVEPHRGDWRLFLDGENLQSLCKPCHSRKTATEDSGFAKGGTTQRPGCDANGWPLDRRHPWNSVLDK